MECVRAVRARAGTNNCTDDGDPRRLHNQSAPFDRRGGRINSADVRAHISRNGRFGGERVTHQLTRRGTEQARTPEVSPPVDDTTSHHLVYSKLKPPRAAATCIQRPALLSRLDATSKQKLTLLTAPIGSGKTTLLTQWHDHVISEQAVAWLSLDEADDDPLRLFTYLIAAVRVACPPFDAHIAHGHDASEALSASSSIFISALGRIERPLTIVLDDVQSVSSPALVRALDTLLQRSPDHVRWILCGRGMPTLHMSQLRLNDQLATLSAAELDFDIESIVQLGQKLCQRTLSEQEAACILRQTEGWVAGVKLALLADAEPRDGTDDFNGSHHEVARYLGTSVLQEQTQELRDFLLASSVPERITAELCNALLGINHSQRLLEQLERSQLFIQPLDSHGHWYRYHT